MIQSSNDPVSNSAQWSQSIQWLDRIVHASVASYTVSPHYRESLETRLIQVYYKLCEHYWVCFKPSRFMYTSPGLRPLYVRHFWTIIFSATAGFSQSDMGVMKSTFCRFFCSEFHCSKFCFCHHDWRAFTYTPVSYEMPVIFISTPRSWITDNKNGILHKIQD